MTQAMSLDDVVTGLEALQRTLPPSDGVRWFNRLYLDVTRAVREVVRKGGLEVPPFLERLDVFFGNRYFAALDDADHGRQGSHAWAPLFDSRHDERLAPLQFALAGMNAHINYDLAVGVVATCEELGMEPGHEQHDDYQSVNGVMGVTEAEAKHWLLTGAVKELDHVVAPADDMAALWSLKRARDAAWIRGRVLWALRGQEELTAEYLAVTDRATGLGGRALLLPLP